MRDAYAKIQEAGGQVAVVTMGTVAQAAEFRRRWQLPFVCLADPERKAYRALGLSRGGMMAVAGPSTWLRGWRALWRHGLGWIIGDPYQLPGAFIIDKNGRIHLAHRARNSTEWPTIDQIIQVLRSLPFP